MRLSNQTTRSDRVRGVASIPGPGSHTFEGPPLPVNGPGERSNDTDDLVRVVAALCDAGGIINTCSVELLGRFQHGQDLAEGILVSARATQMVAESIPVARSMAIVPRFTVNTSGAGDLVVLGYLSPAVQRTEGDR